MHRIFTTDCPITTLGGDMGNRRNFGSVNARTSKSTGHKYYEARYRPPIEARAKWPNLPQYITKNFP